MRGIAYILGLICLSSTLVVHASERQKKFLSAFQIITFNNDPCSGSSSKNGTCYTASECEAKGGTSAGSCAQGYGVCCTFSAKCGVSSSENCTYFEQSGGEVGECSVQICKCRSNICQLRLDFEQFTITGPSTFTLSSVKLLNGDPVAAAGADANLQSQCLTDSFTVTNPGGTSPPTICGINSDEHMYVDASPSCNDLVFQLGNTGNGAALSTRRWSIKVTQYTCDYENLAPTGCTQYFFGSPTGQVRTYNYQMGLHLANQNQNICIRRETAQCRICWAPTAVIDFAVSGTVAAMGFIVPSSCCGYGADGEMVKGFDCLSIPGAVSKTLGTKFVSRFCGNNVGLAKVTLVGPDATFCTTNLPFNVRFKSDNYEFLEEAKLKNKGFQLMYEQDCP